MDDTGRYWGTALTTPWPLSRGGELFGKRRLTHNPDEAYKPLIDGEGAAGEPFGSLLRWPRARYSEDMAGNGLYASGPSWKSCSIWPAAEECFFWRDL